MRTILHSQIYRENILPRLDGVMCQKLLTDQIRIWKSGDSVNSKRDYTIGLIVLDLWSQSLRSSDVKIKLILFNSRQ